MYIKLLCQNFTRPNGVNGSRTTPATVDQLLWAAATVGYAPEARQYWAGVGSFHVLARMAAVMGGLSVKPRRVISTTGAYRSLESSERAWQTYVLGMTVAKWVAYSELGVTWLQHLAHTHWRILTTGTRRPDLVGWGPRTAWCVVEAKGRQRGTLAGALSSGKEQVQAVASVNGSEPLRVAAATKFTAKAVECVLSDPHGTGSAQVGVDESDYLAAYYAPILSILQQARRAETLHRAARSDVVGAYLPSINAWVGLRNDIFLPLDGGESLRMSDVLDPDVEEPSGHSEPEHEGPYSFIGPDGVAVGRGQ